MVASDDKSALPLILASSSPRRRQLLAEADYIFRVVPPHESAEGEIRPGEPPTELVRRLAAQKAADVAQRIDRGLVIGCDTVAECDGAVLGKPRDKRDAWHMLDRLRGREHRVYSGLCLWRRPDDCQLVEVAVTRLVMDPLTDEQLAAYLETGAWEGKAGAFGYQDGLDWVRVLQGSQSNVVGLPMELFEQMAAQMRGA